jgi:FMN phosphatase YigB (HAD superfamily)
MCYEKLIEELGVSPENLILIDDKEKNVNAAKAMGISGILYKNPGQLSRELEKFYKPRKDDEKYDVTRIHKDSA